MTLSDSLRNFLDEVMPAIVGTTRADGSVQMNPIWYERRGDGQHEPADPRLLVRVRPTRATGTFREEAAA